MTEQEPTTDWLTERLAHRRRPGDPDYDAFYDASDDELSGMVAEVLARMDVPTREAPRG